MKFIQNINPTKLKKRLRIFWLLLVLFGIGFYLYSPDSFTQENISLFIKNQNANLLLIYITISLIRGVFLLPSTPFVLAGAILFPDNLPLVFTISMLGIMGTAILLYYASSYLEFDKLFGEKHSGKFDTITEKINKHGFWIVLGWAFFPLVPTDLICYVAGTIKMNFKKYFLAIFIGEAVLVYFYLFLGKEFLEKLF